MTIAAKLIEIFTKAFQGHGQEEAAQSTAHQPKKQAPPGKKTSEADSYYIPLDDKGFVDKIKKIAARNPALMAGGISIIGLSSIKKHFAGNWPLMADKVHAIIRQIISQRLGREDVFTSYRDSAYIIVFARLAQEQGNLKCAIMAEEISRRIFGERANPSIIEVATVAMDQKKGLSVVKLDLEEFSRKIDSGRLAGIKRHEIFAPLALSQEESSMDEPLAGNEDEGEIAKFRHEMELLARLPSHEKQKYSLGKLGFVYRPMWLVKKEVTAGYVCIPARITSEGTTLVGGKAVLASPGSNANAEHDRLCLLEAAKELELLISHGKKPVLIVPVHYVTMTEPRHRDGYKKIMKGLPLEFLNKMLYELIGIPKGAPRVRLEEIVLQLRAANDNVLVRVRLDNDDFTKFAELGVYAIGFDIANLNKPEPALIKDINDFAERAEREGLKTYARGLRTKSLISAAVCAGYDYIDGDPVTSPVEMPGEAAPFSIGSLYKRRS